MIPKTMTRRLVLGLACVVMACVAASATAGEGAAKLKSDPKKEAARTGDEPRTLKSDPSQEYYLYLPANFDPAKRYWLFVGVHGLGGNGKGAMGWSSFAEEGQCIVVGPSFTGTYQFPANGSGAGKGMLGIFKELSHEYKLYPKAFLTGFSAGAQFVHRFTLENPQLVVACAAHSAGSWGMPNAKARGVPFVVTCGEDDKERLGLAKEFARDAKSKGFQVTPPGSKASGTAPARTA
jgi:poly(3-hydroxybutyrate) depolymerase